MPSPTEIAIYSTIIALGALGVSLASLWKTHFAKFNPITTVGRLCQRIYPIRSEEHRWYISSFDLPITVTNEGARPGNVIDLRLSIHFPSLPIPGNKELIRPIFEIDPSNARKINRERFKWIEEIVIGEWMPFTVLPKKSVTKHLLFETRWEKPVVQDRIIATLELMSDSSEKWKHIGTWEFSLRAELWGELANRGRSCAVNPKGSPQYHETCQPLELHKYTSSKEEIPENGFGANPSYLDFPKDQGYENDES